MPLGNLEVHPLSRLARLGSGRGSGDPLAPAITDLAMADDPALNEIRTAAIGSKKGSATVTPPSFHASKMFEIDSCQGYGKNCQKFK